MADALGTRHHAREPDRLVESQTIEPLPSPSTPDRTSAVISLAVVVPVYQEEKIVEELATRLHQALDALPGVRWSVLFVDDGSRDATLRLLSQLTATDSRFGLIALSRNFGHQLAITAGLDHALGDVVVVIDGDLQDPPELIGTLLQRWREGYDVVYAVRAHRHGETAWKRWSAAVFYRMIRALSDVDLPVDTGDFRLMDRAVVDSLCALREENRYVRGMVAWVGFRQVGVPYERDARYAGTAKYTTFKSLRLAFDGITSFSERPLRFSGLLGMMVTVIAVITWVYIVMDKLLNPATVAQGWTSMMAVVLMLAGVQLISIGMLGEYVGRIFRETKRRPLYVVAARRGLPLPPPTPARRGAGDVDVVAGSSQHPSGDEANR